MADRSRGQAENRFLSGPILPPLVKFALPLMLSLMLQALYGGVDLAVVGRFSPTESVAAVATGSQVMQATTVVVTGLTMGVTVLLGKAIGAGDRETAGCVVAGQVRLFTLVAVVMTLVMVTFAPQAARFMNVPESAIPETVRYVRICSGGMVFITAYNAISGIFRGIGNSRSPFLFVSIACVVNIVLDLLFVGVFHLDASGAALATVIAQAVSVVFSAGYMRRRPLPFQVTRDSFRRKGMVGRILKVGAPIALQDFLVNVSFLIITKHCQYAGTCGSGRDRRIGKAICVPVHCADGIYVGAVRFCRSEHGSREAGTGGPLSLYRPGHILLLRRGHVFADLLCRRSAGFPL